MNKPFYKQKLVVIETVDGKTFEIDLNKFKFPPEMKGVQFPIGYDTPADDPIYRWPVLVIQQGGYTDLDQSTPDCYVHIPPSQIKRIKVRFVPVDSPMLNIID